MKILINRRRVHRISQEALAARMGCSHQWVSIIEGMATGVTFTKWQKRYEEALEQILAERKA